MSNSHDEEDMLVTYYAEEGVVSTYVRRVDFERLRSEIKLQTDEARAHDRRCAIDALEEASRLIDEGDQTAANLIEQICIWFAHEVADGRATFDPAVEYEGNGR